MSPDELIEVARAAVDDAYDIPARGAKFASSVIKKLEGIIETVERTDRVTPAQERAVRNMADGVSRWL